MMDAKTLQSIKDEIALHNIDTLQAIDEFCQNVQAKRHLRMGYLGKAISIRFNIDIKAAIKLANGWNRYMFY